MPKDENSLFLAAMKSPPHILFRQIRILFLEDNLDDVELELYELRKGGFDVSHELARNREEFLSNLNRLNADIIIADYSLPDMTGIDAIQICKERQVAVPVILITGIGNEQLAVDSLREGAIDFILKKNIAVLPTRLARALEIWADRQAIKQSEKERRLLQQQLFQAQKMESVGRLAGGIAHDFNNLLTVILGFAAVTLKSLSPDSPVHGNIKTIIEVSQKAADLVRQLLLFSRNIPMELKYTNVNTIITETVKLVKHMMEETVEIKLVLQDNLPPVLLDAGQLKQVLINLAVNARDAINGNGAIEFRTEKTYLGGRLFRQGENEGIEEYVSISVKDTGCGISEENMPRIFEPFFTTKEVGKGTGLGLAIVYSIVNNFGGWVDVKSMPGKGTTFTIQLPLLKGQAAVAVQEQLNSLDMPARLLTGTETILFVEDEDYVRDFLAGMIREFGYNILIAKNGAEALEIYRKAIIRIDLVVSDMGLPEKSGLELFEELKSIDPNIKFILITGYCMDITADTSFKKIDAFLMKPFSVEKIVKVIRTVLDREPMGT